MAPVRLNWGHGDFSFPLAFDFDSYSLVKGRFAPAPGTVQHYSNPNSPRMSASSPNASI